VRSFRKRIAVVSQSVHLFGGSIRDNLLYGLTPEERRSRGFDGADGPEREAAETELRRVTEMTGCDFIADYPLRLETRLGTGGIKLSGGQKQCIAIARALLKQPALLILDEATSALDAKTQAHVAKAIDAEQARLGFTVVQTAPRLETLKGSDVVYFFAHGRVVEVGGADSLTKSGLDELLQVPIRHTLVPDFETGVGAVRRLRGGYFHDMWNRAQGVTPPESMGCAQLAERQAELRRELAKIDKAMVHKAALRQLRVRLLAVRLLARVRPTA
jgi:ABC-type methionine transport system ATPase subunit